MTEKAAKVNLLGLDRRGLEAFFATLGEKPFRARQVMRWLYRHGVHEFAAMSDLGKALRGRLEACAEVRLPEVATEQVSADGTRKWFQRVDAANGIETVFIPEGGERSGDGARGVAAYGTAGRYRGTLCVSSQVGCAMDCSFCATGKQGFNRNLAAAEIIGQVFMASRALSAPPSQPRAVTNVVFMGMGEPLANYRHLLPAIRILLDDFGYGLSKRRVTVSTSGLVPNIYRLAQDCDVALAVSLHAPNDALRDELVPINRVHPLAELIEACRYYVRVQAHAHAHVTFEYVMLEGVNDSLEQARELAALVRSVPCKVNLIPFNPFPGTRYRRSSPAVIDRFAACLWRQGIVAVTRRTRGEDIDAACGQLAGQVEDRIRRARCNKPQPSLEVRA